MKRFYTAEAVTEHLCLMATLKWQQVDGLNTVLPYGIRKINALRTLTTESTAVLIPFHAQVRERNLQRNMQEIRSRRQSPGAEVKQVRQPTGAAKSRKYGSLGQQPESLAAS